MAFKNIIISFILMSVFAVALIFASVSFSASNGSSHSLVEDSVIGNASSSLSIYLNNSQNTAEAQAESLKKESSQNPVLTTLGFFFRSILNAGTTYIESIYLVSRVIFSTISNTLMINPMVTGAVTAILLVILVLGAWRLYRVGE